MFRRSIVGASALALSVIVAGCSSTPATPTPTTPQSSETGNISRGPQPPTPPAPPTTATCDARKAQGAIGHKASDTLLERARLAAGAATARFVRPDQPITLEFLESRLTLGLDRREVVISVTCG